MKCGAHRQVYRALNRISSARSYLLSAMVLYAAFGGHAAAIILKRSWVDEYKNRATITAQFTVDHAHKKPNAQVKDGDMHVAGRSPAEVGLPMVAEVVNAAASEQERALKLIHDNEGTSSFVSISGAWRLWFEHPAKEEQRQFAKVPVAANTNPDHCFEIHPVSDFDGEDLARSFDFIPSFSGYDAAKAFGAYEGLPVTVKETAETVKLTSKKAAYNYTHFHLHVLGKTQKLGDGGYAVWAQVSPDSGRNRPIVARKVRMILVPGTTGWRMISDRENKSERDQIDDFDALGIPRINLDLVARLVKRSRGNEVTATLPYEIIVVGMRE